ncbi:MAG: DUF1254 domain-containing protein [Halobacteriota archaeon]
MKSPSLAVAEVLILIALLAIAACGCTTTTQNATTSANQTIGGITFPTTMGPPTAAEAQQIAAAAYVFGYPLVLMDATKAQQTAASAPTPDGSRAPVNQFVRATTPPNASFTSVVTANVDTLYASAWLNLTTEPIVLNVPDTTGRYYMMPILSAWTDVFSSPGTRTTGTNASNFAIVGPGWNGTLPSGLTKVEAPTETAWIVGRTQLNGPADVPAVTALQAQYNLTPLSSWGTNYTPPTNVPVNPGANTTAPPSAQVANMTPSTFYGRMATLMVANPPSTADKPVVDQMARIGLIPGRPFDWNGLNATMQNAVAQGAKDGLALVNASSLKPPGIVFKNGWGFNYGLGSYGTNYTLRAGTAWLGLGANLPEDAFYPATYVNANGTALTGAHTYVIHFAANGTPPVNAFWSITMYNSRNFLVNNSLDRYAIAQHLGNLTYNADGSLDIYVQNTSPGLDKEANWLPAPSDEFHLVMRLYWPQEAVLNGSWVPPAVQQVG